ncbi:HAD family hydrolase [Ornithinimicrobium pratense]|uniref:HAD family phosphatase n=1 Tax=Ornithinimicrobium pratense TaxID=2593973 RepID=A0A5J6V4Z8_9MICO|nr:HAD family hydrolase [Ornithinimicrobium pratense]QFG68838.1 HAD family phosphatase [Ornithinimicrobium pratense]
MSTAPQPSPRGEAGFAGPPPRLIATDCDGTLLRSDGTVSTYTRDVLAELARVGFPTILVTARPPRWMDELADLGVTGLALCGNGAFTYDLGRREIVAHRQMDAALVGELLGDLRRELSDVALATESLRGFAREPHFERATGRNDGQWLVGPVEELARVDAGKILVRHPHLHTEELTALVEDVVGDRAEVSHSGAIRMTEIVPAGVTKALALSHWCQEQDPPVAAEAVWAFGDMPNDLPMLAWAGVAHAVANAHPDVLAVADQVVPRNDEDGVARTLEERLLGWSAGRAGMATPIEPAPLKGG